MDTYYYVLYIHLLSLFVGIGAATVLSLCLFQLRRAPELTDALPWGRVAGKTGRMFPIAILGLFGSGAYMTNDIWTWSTGWIEVGIVGLFFTRAPSTETEAAARLRAPRSPRPRRPLRPRGLGCA